MNSIDRGQDAQHVELVLKRQRGYMERALGVWHAQAAFGGKHLFARHNIEFMHVRQGNAQPREDLSQEERPEMRVGWLATRSAVYGYVLKLEQ